jgi:mono/diheme cytochrome c family protein
MAKTVAAWRHVALAMIVAGSTSAASAQSSDGSFMSSRRFMQRDGEVLYRTVCQSCHMAAAQGAVGNALRPFPYRDMWVVERAAPCIPLEGLILS